MANDGPGDWGQPQFDDSSAPDIAVNPTLVADYFAELAPRRFDTWALLAAETVPDDGYLARIDTAPGAIFTRVSGNWEMGGVPVFASESARNTALPSPRAGWRAYTSDYGVTWIHTGSAWVVQHARATVFTRASATIASGTTLLALDFTDAAIAGLGTFTESAGVFTCVAAGTYKVTLVVTFAANATGLRGASMAHSGAGLGSHAQVIAAQSSTIPQTVTVSWVAAFTATQTLTVTGLQSSGGTLAVTAEIVFERVA